MIDYIKSAELNGMSVDELKTWFEKYPGSQKRAVVVCEGCNKVRNIKFQDYRRLCHKCAMTAPNRREASRLQMVKQWKDPLYLAEASRREIMRCSDPDVRAAHSRKMKKYYKDNPEAVVAMSKRCIQYHIDNPEAGAKQGDALKNSDAAKASAENMRGGNDIVRHHVAYDFNCPDAFVTMVTRRRHGEIHKPKGIGVHQRGYISTD